METKNHVIGEVKTTGLFFLSLSLSSFVAQLVTLLLFEKCSSIGAFFPLLTS